jgi:hypothetical protein
VSPRRSIGSKLAQSVRLSRLSPKRPHLDQRGGEDLRVHEHQLVAAALEQATTAGDGPRGAGCRAAAV